MPETDSFFQNVDPNAGNQILTEAMQSGQIPPATQDPQQGQPGVAPAQSAQTEGAVPRPLPEHMSPEHVYGMATYQQSRADKALAEASRLQAEIEALQTANPIAAYVARDPAVLQQVIAAMSGQSSSGGQMGGASAAGAVPSSSPQKPMPPQRPAEMEPYSEEAIKYQTDLIDYQAKLADYNQSIFDGQVQRLQQAEVNRQRVLEQQQQALQVKQEAMYQHGLSEQEAVEFIQFASDPRNANDMGLWVNAFKLSKGKGNQQMPGQTPRPPQQGQATAADIARANYQRQMTATAAPGAPGGQVQQQESFFTQPANRVQIW
jgi:hypothetical protein